MFIDCSVGCAKCIDSPKCQACEPGYLLSDSSCTVIIQPDISQAKAIAGVQQVFGAIAGSSAKVISAIKYANPVSLCLALKMDMVQFLRYINITYPPQLQAVFDNADDLTISFVPSIPDQLAVKFPASTLPDNFQKYGFASSFFVNFWQSEISLLVLFAGLISVYLLEKCTKNCTGVVRTVCLKMKTILKWNYTLTLLLASAGQILFFASFDFRTNTLSQLAPILSFILCCFLHLVLVCILFKMIYVITSIRRTPLQDNATLLSTDQSHRPRFDTSKWEEYEIIFGEFKHDSFLHQAYLPIYTLRIYLFYLVVAYMFDYPLAQIIVITLLNISMILYLLIIQPSKSKVQLIENLVVEVVLLIIDSLLVALAILDKSHTNAETPRRIIGKVVVAVNTGLCIVGGTYLLAKLVINVLSELRQAIKSYRNKRKISPSSIGSRGDTLPSRPTETENNKMIRDTSHGNSSSTAINQRELHMAMSTLSQGHDDSSINIQANQANSLSNIQTSGLSLQNPPTHFDEGIDLAAQSSNSPYKREGPIRDQHLEQEVHNNSFHLRNPNRKLILDQIRRECGYLNIPTNNNPGWKHSSLVARNLSENVLNTNEYSNSNVANNQLDREAPAYFQGRTTNTRQQQTMNLDGNIKLEDEKLSTRHQKLPKKE